MNATAKGNRRQNSARKKLEAEGWLVEVARRPMFGYGSVDFFKCWDIIAYKDGYFKLVQCKSNYCPPSAKVPLKEFKVDGMIVVKELWVYKNYSRANPWIEVLGNG